MKYVLAIGLGLFAIADIIYVIYMIKHTKKLYEPQCRFKEEPTYIVLLGVHVIAITFLIYFIGVLFE